MSALLLPPELWQEIVTFVRSGKTGKVELSVRRGKVTGISIAASYQTDEYEAAPRIVELNDPLRRQVQCER
ncbi:MAG: hypothetical protein IT337_09320 [Thermomicrobiales bacterium]|nr:hypothetical protein [Thermomicrobiales bacterium]